MTGFILPFAPEFIITIIFGIVAVSEFFLLVKVGNIARSYAKMTVRKTRIQADGKITLDEPDIIPFIEETFRFMTELESVVHYITGYILNHPSTGWIKGYEPQLISVQNAVFKELAKEEGNDITLQNNPGQQTVPPPEQPAQ